MVGILGRRHLLEVGIGSKVDPLGMNHPLAAGTLGRLDIHLPQEVEARLDIYHLQGADDPLDIHLPQEAEVHLDIYHLQAAEDPLDIHLLQEVELHLDIRPLQGAEHPLDIPRPVVGAGIRLQVAGLVGSLPGVGSSSPRAHSPKLQNQPKVLLTVHLYLTNAPLTPIWCKE